jgi:hypothetical protein
MLQASAQSLRKTWLAGIDLSARAKTHPRIASMAAALLKGFLEHVFRPGFAMEYKRR